MFLRSCFPQIVAALPQIRLRIHGAITEMQDLKQLVAQMENSANVTMSGPSEDMGDIYATARVVICPIRHGTGMKIKMIEAMAHGKAIVATSQAAEGIASDLGIIGIDSSVAFAKCCVKLIIDPEARRQSEHNALSTFARDHDHAQLVASLNKMLRELLNG